jgi:hypothetical protein
MTTTATPWSAPVGSVEPTIAEQWSRQRPSVSGYQPFFTAAVGTSVAASEMPQR